MPTPKCATVLDMLKAARKSFEGGIYPSLMGLAFDLAPHDRNLRHGFEGALLYVLPPSQRGGAVETHQKGLTPEEVLAWIDKAIKSES
jgi:hypothetical protein